jgi:hypothetical protein
MKESFGKIFWGFLLVLIEIHLIVVDILPDPLGYFYIYTGIQNLIQFDKKNAERARLLSIILIFFSLPAMFIQNSSIQQIGEFTPLNGWSIYMTILGFAKLILVYYIFKLMLSIGHVLERKSLIKRTQSVFRFYMIVILTNYVLQSFMINLSNDLLMGLIIFIIVGSLIVEITFLALLRTFRNTRDPVNQPPNLELL